MVKSCTKLKVECSEKNVSTFICGTIWRSHNVGRINGEQEDKSRQVWYHRGESLQAWTKEKGVYQVVGDDI